MMIVFALLKLIECAVSGTVKVELVNPQASYCAGGSATFKVTVDGVPNTVPGKGVVYINSEIRGTKPGGPRGFIAEAMPKQQLQTFLAQGGTHTFKFPLDYAGFNFFFRPAVFTADEEGTSSNFLNSGGSANFNVVECVGSVNHTNGSAGSSSVVASASATPTNTVAPTVSTSVTPSVTPSASATHTDTVVASTTTAEHDSTKTETAAPVTTSRVSSAELLKPLLAVPLVFMML